MTTLATGGYSTSDQSIAHFDSAAVEWIAVAFMVLGSLPFVLYVHLLRRRSTQRLWRDSQVRAFLSFLGLVTLAVTAWLWTVHDLSLAMALRRAAFNVTSVVTTTGYASADFGSWGQFALLAFLLLIFAGGCTGSTAGAVKTFRFQMLRLLLRRRLFQLAHPHAVFAPKYNGRMVSDDVLAGAAEFVVIYVAAAAILAMALSLFGLDIVTSLSGAATALGNVGPGLGPLIGPSGTFASLPDGAKWLLSLGMLLGRLELFTVLVLFAPQFWRI